MDYLPKVNAVTDCKPDRPNGVQHKLPDFEDLQVQTLVYLLTYFDMKRAADCTTQTKADSITIVQLTDNHIYHSYNFKTISLSLLTGHNLFLTF